MPRRRVAQRRAAVTTLFCTQRDRAGGFGGGTAFFAPRRRQRGDLTDWTCDRRELFDARGRARRRPTSYGQAQRRRPRPLRGARRRASRCAPARRSSASSCSATAPSHEGRAARSPRRPRWCRRCSAAAAVRDALGRAARRHRGAHARPAVRRDGQPLAAVPDARLPALGARPASTRPAAPTAFATSCRTRWRSPGPRPTLLRQQILLAASRQFAEGDVQHWWHAPTGAGVRTHFSDDLLWLPLRLRALRARPRATPSVLDESVPFLEGARDPGGRRGRLLRAGGQRRTRQRLRALRARHRPQPARRRARPAADGHRRLERRHEPRRPRRPRRIGLARPGSCATSSTASRRWPSSAATRARAARWRDAARGWRARAAERRLGRRTGTGAPSSTTARRSARAANDECRIDLIAQAWAVLSGAAPEARARQAMAALERAPGRPRGRPDPPARSAARRTPQPSAGYIQAYPPGVRENGGQYSHAGVWALMAQAAARRRATPPTATSRYLSPAHRSRHAERGRGLCASSPT